jgi:hypothetical protein
MIGPVFQSTFRSDVKKRSCCFHPLFLYAADQLCRLFLFVQLSFLQLAFLRRCACLPLPYLLQETAHYVLQDQITSLSFFNDNAEKLVPRCHCSYIKTFLQAIQSFISSVDTSPALILLYSNLACNC